MAAKSQKSLDSWTKEEWGTKSGKNSTQGKNALVVTCQRKQESLYLIRSTHVLQLVSVLHDVKVSSSVNSPMTLLTKQRGIEYAQSKPFCTAFLPLHNTRWGDLVSTADALAR